MERIKRIRRPRVRQWDEAQHQRAKQKERRNMKYDRIYTGNEEIVEKSNDMGKILPL